MVAERCVSKSGAVSADPHHTCRYGSSPAAHRLVVPALSFPSDREPSLYHRSRLASFYADGSAAPHRCNRSRPPLRAWGHVPRRALKRRAVAHDRPIDVSFHGSGSVACEDRDGACPFGGSSTPVTGPAGRWPPSQLWAINGLMHCRSKIISSCCAGSFHSLWT